MNKQVILSKQERLYFNRGFATGRLKKVVTKSAYQKVVEELSKKLPVNLN